MALKVIPLFDRVLIQRDVVANRELGKTKAGIYIPDATQVDPLTGNLKTDDLELNTGTILSIGEGVTHPLLVEGAKVYFGKFAGASINPYRTEVKKQMALGQTPTMEDEKLFVCAEADIIAVLEGEEEPKNEETADAA